MRGEPVTNISPHVIEKFLADSRHYFAYENPYFKRLAGFLPPASPRLRPPGHNPTRWESRSSL